MVKESKTPRLSPEVTVLADWGHEEESARRLVAWGEATGMRENQGRVRRQGKKIFKAERIDHLMFKEQ